MKSKIIKFIFCFIICSCAVVFFAKESYADQRNGPPHIHIKGKVATPDGQGVAGALLSFQSNSSCPGGSCVQVFFVTGLPSWIVVTTHLTETATSPTSNKTSANGEYHILLSFVPIQGHRPEEINLSMFSIDRSKMEWKKDGYSIKPK